LLTLRFRFGEELEIIHPNQASIAKFIGSGYAADASSPRKERGDLPKEARAEGPAQDHGKERHPARICAVRNG